MTIWSIIEEKVKEIKILLSEGKRNKDIAEIYGVTDSVISKIKTGLLWSNVEIKKEIVSTGILSISDENINISL